MIVRMVITEKITLPIKELKKVIRKWVMQKWPTHVDNRLHYNRMRGPAMRWNNLPYDNGTNSDDFASSLSREITASVASSQPY